MAVTTRKHRRQPRIFTETLQHPEKVFLVLVRVSTARFRKPFSPILEYLAGRKLSRVGAISIIGIVKHPHNQVRASIVG